MKKRMFITTIVMMLVLAVALTTSSLAWFSASNANVTASAATFVAKTRGGSQSLKITTSTGNLESSKITNWSDSIDLYNVNSSTTIEDLLVPLVPTTALVSTYVADSAWKGAGVVKQLAGGATEVRQQTVAFQNYQWPTKIDFNGAKIDANGNFIIGEGNAIETKGIGSYNNAAADGFFYKSFFIKNADVDTTITSLTFQVKVDMSATSPDYTANGVAAFIIYDQIKVPVDPGTTNANVVPAGVIDDNKAENGGKTVVAYNIEAASFNAETMVKATSVDDPYYYCWKPFAAFTFNTSKMAKTVNSELVGIDTNNTNANWQFATLTAAYNGTAPSALKAQSADCATNKGDWDKVMSGETVTSDGDDEAISTNIFTLDSAKMQALNNKYLSEGLVSNRTENQDGTSAFQMIAGEVYRVDFYYWLDGKTLTEETDTTASTIELTIGVGSYQ